MYSSSGEIVYPAAALAVVYSKSAGKQRFLQGAHTDEIIGIAAHPSGQIFATGEYGRNPAIIVWDATDMRYFITVSTYISYRDMRYPLNYPLITYPLITHPLHTPHNSPTPSLFDPSSQFPPLSTTSTPPTECLPASTVATNVECPYYPSTPKAIYSLQVGYIVFCTSAHPIILYQHTLSTHPLTHALIHSLIYSLIHTVS